MAVIIVLLTKGNFSLFNFSSSEPSNTIKTKPTEPKIGKRGFKSGIIIWKISAECLETQPNINSNITVGIFVLDDEIVRIYAKSNKVQIVIIIAKFIQLFF